MPRDQVDAVEQRMRKREVGDREVGDSGANKLLAQAAGARAAGLLDGDDNAALPLYQRVLELQPKRTAALEGREDTLADLLQQARTRWRAAISPTPRRACSGCRPPIRGTWICPTRWRSSRVPPSSAADAPMRTCVQAASRRRWRGIARCWRRRRMMHRPSAAWPRSPMPMPHAASAWPAISVSVKPRKRCAQARAVDADAPGVAAAQTRLTQSRQAQQRYGNRLPTRGTPASPASSCWPMPPRPKRVATC